MHLKKKGTYLNRVSFLACRWWLDGEGLNFQNDSIGRLDANEKETVRSTERWHTGGNGKPDKISGLGETLSAICKAVNPFTEVLISFHLLVPVVNLRILKKKKLNHYTSQEPPLGEDSNIIVKQYLYSAK